MTSSSGHIYLDHSATTPVDARVLDKMLPYFSEHFGNPASENHAWGWKAKNATDEARKLVAGLINATPLEIYFTSGATESNNWVFFGLVSFLRKNSQEKIHIISNKAEHASVVEPLVALEKTGVEVSWVELDQYGMISAKAIEKLIKPHTQLVSVMSGNNEFGTLNPIQEIAELCQSKSIYFHTDVTQTIGKIRLDLEKTPASLVSFSIHKAYGPKGIGALYIRRRNPKVQIDPLFYGGGHEHGMRSGTLNVPLIVGMGEAARIANEEGVVQSSELDSKAQKLWKELKNIFPSAVLNGHPTERIPGHLSVNLPGFPHTKVLPRLAGVGISTASACSTGNLEGSKTLSLLSSADSQSNETYRLTVGRSTTDQQIAEVVEIFKKISAF